jgi:endonuclease YncB( thermonuclease family)
MISRFLAAGFVAVLVVCASPAAADPCKAIPDKGPSPAWLKAGASFQGKVRHIIDGDGLCVGNGTDPATWIEVRLGDFDAPELATYPGRQAKTALSRIAVGKQASCRAIRGRSGRVRVYDRVIAVCRIDGRSVGDAMRSAGIREGGN